MQTLVYGSAHNTPSKQARAAVTDGVTSTSRPQSKGELQMDPTMGQAPIATVSDEQQTLTTETVSNVIGMSGYVNRDHMAADVASTLAYPADTEAFAADVSTETVLAAVTGEEQPVAAEVLPETPPSPPKYPVGKIDFNKPFEIFRADDFNQSLTEASIIAVLTQGTHPVVIAGYDGADGEHIVLQFDLEGDDISGDWTLENLSTEPQTKFVRLFVDGDRNYTVDDTLYDTEGEANRAHTYTDVFGVFPIVIPPRAPAVIEATALVPTEELTDDEYSEEEEHDEGADFQSETAVVETAPAAPPHPDAKWVNGRLIAPGQVVRFHKQYIGVRDVEVIKTRDHAYATLFVKPMDGSNPYWALNKNLR
jgi:hypothetical protein